MLRTIAVSVVLIMMTISLAGGQQLRLHISAPADSALVPERPLVEGTVSDRRATVWVIVHPMKVTDYWVQPKPTIRDDGRWRVQIFIGRPGDIDMGKSFEIMAVANPKAKLKVGQVLDDWPEAQGKSSIVEVSRR